MAGVVPNTPDHVLAADDLQKGASRKSIVKSSAGVKEQWDHIAEGIHRRFRKKTHRFVGYEDETKRTHFGSWIVMNDGNKLRNFLGGIYVVSTIYFATLFPYKLAFVDFRIGANDHHFRPSDFLVIADQIFDVIVFIELWMTFFCSYRDWDLDGEHEVDDLRAIAKRYLAGSFFLDALGSIPFVPIARSLGIIEPSSFTDDSTKSVLVLRMRKQQRVLKMFRFLRIFRMSRAIRSSVELGYALYNLIKFRVLHALGFLCMLLWSVHLLACGYYLAAAVASMYSDSEVSWVGQMTDPYGTPLLSVGPIQQWVHAMYLIMAQFFGMDMEAVAYSEMAYACLVQLWGNVVTAAILGAVMDLMREADRDGARLREVCSRIHDFARYTHLNPLLQRELEVATYERQNNMEVDTEQLRTLFRSSMFNKDTMRKVCLDLYQGKLVKNNLFWNPIIAQLQPPLRLILSIACVLKQRVFHCNEIYGPGDMPACVHLCLRGTFAFVDDMTEGQGECFENERKDDVGAAQGAPERRLKEGKFSPYLLLGHKCYFGDIEITAKDSKRRHSVHCVSATAEALEMSRDDFNEICEDFPQFGKGWEVVAKWREASRRRARLRWDRLRDYQQIAEEYRNSSAFEAHHHQLKSVVGSSNIALLHLALSPIARWIHEYRNSPPAPKSVAGSSSRRNVKENKNQLAQMTRNKMLRSKVTQSVLENDRETAGQEDNSQLAMQLQGLQDLVKELRAEIVESRSERQELRQQLAQLQSDSAAQQGRLEEMLRDALSVKDQRCIS